MPLAEIRSFVCDPRRERLAEYERRAVDEFAERRRVLRHVRKLIEEEPMYDVLTKSVSMQRYESRSRRVRVTDLEPFISRTFEELCAEASAAPPFVLYHGPVNEEDDGPVEVCVPKDDGPNVLPAGEVAFTAIRGEQCMFPHILSAYEAVYRWARQAGREPEGPPREIYVSGEGEEIAMEIALPLRP